MTTPTVPMYELQQDREKWMCFSNAMRMLAADPNADDWRTQVAILLTQWGFPREEMPETWRTDYDKGRVSGRLSHGTILSRSDG